MARKFNAAFWRWFGKSVVTKTGRAGGEPRAMYHGSAAPNIDAFRPGRHERIAGWFSFKKKMASEWAKAEEERYREDDPEARATVYRVYLRAERPFDVRKASHRVKVGTEGPEGYEALYENLEQFVDAMIGAGFDSYLDFEETENPTGIAVFSPTQIKSATGNLGTWSPTDPDIRQNPGYKEIEFVCVNKNFPEATQPAKQRALLNALERVVGVFPYRQDWGEGQVSLAVIIINPKAERTVRQLAKTIGVEIDIDSAFRTDEFLDAAIDGEMEGQI